MPPPTANSSDSLEELYLRVETTVADLKAQIQDRKAAARELARMSRRTVFFHPKKLAAAFQKVEGKLAREVADRCGVGRLIEALSAYVGSASARLRREVGRSLKQRCVQHGHAFHVVSKEEPIEVRIAPLSVLLDFKKHRATFQFARDPLDSCALDTEKILATWDRVVHQLDRTFDPAAFFTACRQAYLRAVHAHGLQDGDRVELLRFLPELAFLMQPRKFHENPSQRNYRPYARAHFAYDVHRLRQASGFVQGGRRLNFGVATGITATRKKRVVYLEDPNGVGEYKLTVFFTPA